MKNKKRFILYWICLPCILLLTSCGKQQPELFEVNHFVDFDIAPGLNTFDTHFFVISPFPNVYKDRRDASGFTAEQIESVQAKTATLSSTFGDINLEFIHRISVHIFDPFNPDDKIEFFYLDPTPFRNATSWRLLPGIADITEWVERDYFGIEIRLEFRQVSPSFIPMRLEFDLRALGE